LRLIDGSSDRRQNNFGNLNRLIEATSAELKASDFQAAGQRSLNDWMILRGAGFGGVNRLSRALRRAGGKIELSAGRASCFQAWRKAAAHRAQCIQRHGNGYMIQSN